MINMVKLPTNNKRMILRVARGHFATSHSHINYYIDVTMQKTRLSEAAETARELVHMYKSTTIVDTILCLDGTQVIGTCMANELTKDGFRNMNAHQTIYIITPEYTSGSQIILRDNIAPMVRGKHVLILAASLTTGFTAQAAVEAVRYYGGQVAGLAAIFATTHEFMGMRVNSIFDPNNLPDYQSYESRGEQLRLFFPVTSRYAYPPDRGLLSPLSRPRSFFELRAEKAPGHPGAMYMMKTCLCDGDLRCKDPVNRSVGSCCLCPAYVIRCPDCTICPVRQLANSPIDRENQCSCILFRRIDRCHIPDICCI